MGDRRRSFGELLFAYWSLILGLVLLGIGFLVGALLF